MCKHIVILHSYDVMISLRKCLFQTATVFQHVGVAITAVVKKTTTERLKS